MKCQDCKWRGCVDATCASNIRLMGGEPTAYCAKQGRFVPRKGGQGCADYKAKPKREADNG